MTKIKHRLLFGMMFLVLNQGSNDKHQNHSAVTLESSVTSAIYRSEGFYTNGNKTKSPGEKEKVQVVTSERVYPEDGVYQHKAHQNKKSFVFLSSSNKFAVFKDTLKVTGPGTPVAEKNEMVSWPKDSVTSVVRVTSPKTGKAWMDRNLGAKRVAESSSDRESFGHLYQWGRAADGHEVRTSNIRNILSKGDQPGHSDFITVNDEPYDWRAAQNDALWQGVKGINNPCPEGFRVPTAAEWESEIQTWSRTDSNGAMDSPLRLPAAGYRDFRSGYLLREGSAGRYWSSTVLRERAKYLNIVSGNAFINNLGRSRGFSVRCVED